MRPCRLFAPSHDHLLGATIGLVALALCTPCRAQAAHSGTPQAWVDSSLPRYQISSVDPSHLHPKPPTTPVLSGEALSPGRVRLTWTPSITGSWSVVYNISVSGLPAHSVIVEGPTTVQIANLLAQTQYVFTVQAFDAADLASEQSPPVAITTPPGDTVPPSAPTNLHLQSSAQISKVRLSWNAGAGNLDVTAYDVYRDGAFVDSVLFDPAYSTLDNFYVAHHVPPGTTHAWTVRARDESGNLSAPSDALVVTQLPSADATPPSAPSSLMVATTGGCEFVDFLFTPADDVVDHYTLDYEVYEDGLLLGFFNQEVFPVSYGHHSYVLRAVDQSGNTSAPSNDFAASLPLICG